MVKQLTSQPAVMFDMPLATFMRDQGKFFSDPFGNAKKMIDNEFVKERFYTGFERDVVMALDGARNKKGRSLAQWGIESGMVLGKVGDIMPVIVGGWCVYQATYDAEMAKHGVEADARREAQITMEMSVERSQQAGALKDQSYFQSQGSIARLFTMFLTSPRQYYSNTYEALLDWRAGHKDSGKGLARRVFVSHVMLPVLFQFCADMVRNVRNLSDGDDETGMLDLNPLDYLRAMLLGPLNGIFIFGHAATYMMGRGMNWIASLLGAEKVKVYDYRLPVIQWFTDFTRALDGSGKGLSDMITEPSVKSAGKIAHGAG
jgi:hypothetical protein